MTTIAKLNVLLNLSSRGFLGGLKGAGGGLKSFGAKLFSNMGTVLKWGGVLGGLAAGGGALVLFKQQLEALDKTAKTSDKLGIGTKELIGMRHAAKLSGLEVNTLDMALQRMTRRVAEAAMGKGEAVSALGELAIDAKELNKLSPDQQIYKIADALTGLETQSDRVRLAFKLFDSEGVALVNMLQNGSGAVRDMVAEADALGIAFDREQLRGIEEANDAVERLHTAFEGIVGTVAVQLAPVIAEFADEGASAVADFGKEVAFWLDAIVNDWDVVWTIIEAKSKEVLIGLQNELQRTSDNLNPFDFVDNSLSDDELAKKLRPYGELIRQNLAILEENAAAREAERAAMIESNNAAKDQLGTAQDFLTTLEDQTAELDKQAKLMEDRASRAQSITESLRTPFEELQAEVRELGELTGRGLLDDETIGRKSEAIKAQLLSAARFDVGAALSSLPGPGTVQRGSAEDVRSLNRRQFEAQARKGLEAVANKQLDVARDQWRELQQIFTQVRNVARTLRDDQPLVIP